MSAYRYITNEGSSFSANFKGDKNEEKKYYQELMRYAQSRKKEIYRYAECLYFRSMIKSYNFAPRRIEAFIDDFKLIDDKLFVLFKWIKYKIKKDIIKSKNWW